MICWHFATDKLRDDSPLPKKGDVLTHPGELEMCVAGFHGSVRAIDALQYAPGANVARVDMSGTVLEQHDKKCASVRTNITDYIDAARTLHEFACWCAEQALAGERAAGRPVDPRSEKAIEVKQLWLDGKATDTELNATWAAARDAKKAAAWDAARDAARDAQNTELEHRLMLLFDMEVKS